MEYDRDLRALYVRISIDVQESLRTAVRGLKNLFASRPSQHGPEPSLCLLPPQFPQAPLLSELTKTQKTFQCFLRPFSFHIPLSLPNHLAHKPLHLS